MYLNYYAAEVNDDGDNPPIGIILCTEKNEVSAEYALGGLSNKLRMFWVNGTEKRNQRKENLQARHRLRS